jgi:hypothetical protein
MYNNVQQFKNWWLKAGRPLRPPFKNSVHTTDIAYAMCLFREGRYQVELYICKPNTQTPIHRHPGIESVSVYLTGHLEFAKEDGEFLDLSRFQKPQANGTHMFFGRSAEINDGTQGHAARIGNTGGAFLIFEHWKDEDPVSVTTHWEGELVGNQHAKTIEASHVANR